MSFIDGIDRQQQVLFPEALDEYVTAENPVRFLDVFVASLDLAALGFQRATPALTGAASPRAYPARMPPLEYPGHFLVKKVTTGGTFRFQHKLLYIANSLVDNHIGLEETDDGIWSIYFNTVLIATLDEHDYIIRG